MKVCKAPLLNISTWVPSSRSPSKLYHHVISCFCYQKSNNIKYNKENKKKKRSREKRKRGGYQEVEGRTFPSTGRVGRPT